MVFEFKIQIMGISKPPVWRKLKVPDNFSFNNFHLAIQNAFGWHNYHLYEFCVNSYSTDFSIQLPHLDSEDYEMDSNKTKLNTFFEDEGDQLLYIYDFGDDWTHKILLEKITQDKVAKPSCIGGKGKCPPEDIGGVPDYQHFLHLGKDPKRPEYVEILEWMGLNPDKKWDPYEFDLELANNMVSKNDYSK